MDDMDWGYTFAQLPAAAARRALTQAQLTMPGPPWDRHDTDLLVNVIYHTLIRELSHHSDVFTSHTRVDVTCWDVDSGARITIHVVLPGKGRQAGPVTVSGPPFTAHPTSCLPDPIRVVAEVAMLRAWQAAQAAREHLVVRNVLDWIAGVTPRFTADGTLLTPTGQDHTSTDRPAEVVLQHVDGW